MKKILFGILFLIVVGCGNEAAQQQPAPVVNANANFRWIQENILVPSCVKCHGAASHSSTKVHSYQSLMDSKAVVAGNPEGSALYLTVASGKMPKKASKLSDEKIAAIADWIRAGAADN